MQYEPKPLRRNRFSKRPPFDYSIRIARENNCDIAVPNGPGIGNVICYTRLIEELSKKCARPLKLLTAPLQPIVGLHKDELAYPLWEHNPFVADIINSDNIDPEIIKEMNLVKDDLCQFNHVIENLCYPFALFPKQLKGSLFLSKDEMQIGLRIKASYGQPLIVIHPYGKTAPKSHSPWYEENWKKLIDLFPGYNFVQTGLLPHDNKNLGIPYFSGTLRQVMALIWTADLFIGFDSSLTHISTCFEKPSLVLWDIVPKELIEQEKQPGFAGGMMLRWSYPQNKNLMILGEKDDELIQLCARFIHEQISLFNGKQQILFT